MAAKSTAGSRSFTKNLFIGVVYYAIGIIHHHQGNRKEMYKNFYKSAAYYEKSPTPVISPFTALSQNLEEDKRWKEQVAINKRLVALMERTKAPVIEVLPAYSSLTDALEYIPGQKKELDYFVPKRWPFWIKFQLLI